NVKGFLANERTFLHWLSLCTVLGAISIGILNFGQSSIVALLFGAISCGFMFYALYQFHTRAQKLSHGKKSPLAKGVSFEDMNGSIAMVIVVFVAVGVNF
ncbi:hypothetical protein EDD86DRAFT_176730, partial [Gorgonomyces haynaldii]